MTHLDVSLALPAFHLGPSCPDIGTFQALLADADRQVRLLVTLPSGWSLFRAGDGTAWWHRDRPAVDPRGRAPLGIGR